MVPMTFIWWIYHFWARFWPYFNFVDFRAYFGPFSLVNRVQFSNADAGAWNSFLRLGIIFYGKLMHKDTKFCYSSFDISTFVRPRPNEHMQSTQVLILQRFALFLRLFNINSIYCVQLITWAAEIQEIFHQSVRRQILHSSGGDLVFRVVGACKC